MGVGRVRDDQPVTSHTLICLNIVLLFLAQDMLRSPKSQRKKKSLNRARTIREDRMVKLRAEAEGKDPEEELLRQRGLENAKAAALSEEAQKLLAK